MPMERKMSQPSFYQLMLIADSNFCNTDFERIADIFLQLKKEKIALHHNDICQRKNTVLGEYTKDVAKTKLKEINHFIKKNDLKINFMLKKASI